MNPFPFMLLFLFFAIETSGQQTYSGNLVLDCDNSDETGPSPAFLYTCNGLQSCPAFLIFRTQPLYDTVAAISKLMSTDPIELARVNDIRDSNKVLKLNREVIVPVTCSCSGKYYQANTSYVISETENYFTMANSVYEGLTTCDSIQRNNVYNRFDVDAGVKLRVPLRCACPTEGQRTKGTKYLLTYSITDNDWIEKISERFNISSRDLALANGFSPGEDDEIYPSTTLLVPLGSEPLSSQTRALGRKGSLSKKRIVIAAVTGTFLAILLCCLIAGFLLWKRNRANGGKNLKWVLPKDIQLGIASVDQLLKIYRFDELEEATDGFSLQNRLSPSVYRGSLKGATVAVKEMGANASKEVKILQKFNHFNLIGLYGVCEHDGACYLVYEFMENGSLKQWLEDKTSHETRSWNTRIRNALDVAKGLQYLHNFANPAYVHKDINSSNILLGKDLRAKISKFGLARSTEKDQSKYSSIKCRFESKGYLAPEYLEEGLVTTKTDVYAFGVVLLELITGRKAVYERDDDDDDDDERKEVMLSEEVISSMGDEEHANGKVNYLIDPRLQARHVLGFVIDQDELALCLLKLSMACLEPLRCASSSCLVQRCKKTENAAKRFYSKNEKHLKPNQTPSMSHSVGSQWHHESILPSSQRSFLQTIVGKLLEYTL